MKKLFLSLFIISSIASIAQPCIGGMAGIYPCNNVDLLSYMSLSEIGANPNNDNTSDIWGWVSPVTGKEYALVGVSNGLAFVDISAPEAPVYLGMLPSHTSSSLWRDVETMDNYCFVGSEASGHGLQVFDMLQLDNVTSPTSFIESAYYGGFGHSHTIAIDPVSKMLMAMGSNTFNGGPHLVDISNPLQPILVGGYQDAGYTHDGTILTYNGPDVNHQGDVIVVACNGNSGWGVVTLNVTDPTDILFLDNYSYPETGYTHQGWFTKDKAHYLIDDELDEQNLGTTTRTHIFDFSDLDNLVYMNYYLSTNTSIDHNLYTKDQFVYESNYRSGVRILDASRVSTGVLNEVGYFDLFPANDLPQYSGTWSNYPYLPSGVNLATSMYDGFFVLRPTLLYLQNNNLNACGQTADTLQLKINADLQFPLVANITGIPGSPSFSGVNIGATGAYNIVISNLNSVPNGTYNCTLQLQTTFGESYDLQFAITVGSAPSTPTLTSVPSTIQYNGFDYTFSWSAVPSATSYFFEVSENDATFGNIVYNSTELENFAILPFNFPFGEGKTYSWRVTAINLCGSSVPSASEDFQWIAAGVNEIAEREFVVYPNPAENEVFIQNFQSGKSLVSVYNATGQLVLSSTFNQPGVHTLSVGELSSGIYTIQVGRITKRLLIK
ncbi:MAG: choice-of-anchor B family protein [Sediminibacterium sp.]